jgi:serine/threonine-protein kinase HipA
MGDLRVELYGHHIGHLVGADFRTFDFAPAEEAFDVFALGSTVLSESIPLVPRPKRGDAAKRRNFFAELLPEGDALTQLAATKRLSTHDVIGLLREYGRDVAGALQIYDPEIPGEPRIPYLEPASDELIGQTLSGIRKAPLGNSGAGGKSALNGVQSKIVLARADDRWSFARDGYPSTHIVKPEPLHGGAGTETTIYDEEYGSRLARRLGLLDYDVHLETFNEVPALVIERYDRSPHSPDGRIHQEDIGQALGVPRTQKYQEQGGALTLQRIALTMTA